MLFPPWREAARKETTLMEENRKQRKQQSFNSICSGSVTPIIFPMSLLPFASELCLWEEFTRAFAHHLLAIQAEPQDQQLTGWFCRPGKSCFSCHQPICLLTTSPRLLKDSLFPCMGARKEGFLYPIHY